MSFYTAPYSQPYSSNRGMTLYPEQSYANNVNYYQPRQQAVGQTWKSQEGQQQGNSGGMDWNSLFGGMFGTGGAQQQAAVDPRNLAGRAKLDYKRQQAQGASPFRNRFGGGTRYSDQGSAAPPPATTNPQTQIGGGSGGGNVTQVDSGIRSGQLSDASIQAGLKQLLAGGTRSMAVPSSLSGSANSEGIKGGLFGDITRANTMKNANDYGRAASQQQADMQHAFEVARANGNLQQSQLASDVNRENVTNGVIQRNTLLDLLGQLMRGFA